MGGQPTNLATARLLPERPYMPGEQFSIFNGNGAEPMSHRGDFDDEFVSRHSADLPDGEGGTMRRVTASLLEILTQVAAVSKDGVLIRCLCLLPLLLCRNANNNNTVCARPQSQRSRAVRVTTSKAWACMTTRPLIAVVCFVWFFYNTILFLTVVNDGKTTRFAHPPLLSQT